MISIHTLDEHLVLVIGYIVPKNTTQFVLMMTKLILMNVLCDIILASNREKSQWRTEEFVVSLTCLVFTFSAMPNTLLSEIVTREKCCKLFVENSRIFGPARIKIWLIRNI